MLLSNKQTNKMKPLKIVLLCATRRGYLFLQQLYKISPDSEFTVMSFKEEPHEPLFLDDIKRFTKSINGKFIQARKLNSKKLVPFWKSKPVDLMLVVSWRYLITPEIFNLPRLGTFVFHDSLLPRYRGFSPTVWAILNDEKQTGVTLFKITNKVDAGKIIDQKTIPIESNDAITNIIEDITKAYLILLKRNFKKLINGKIIYHSQNRNKATFTCKRLPQDNLIDWSKSSNSIYNLIRAVTHPYPGAYCYLNGEKIIIWSAKKISRFPQFVGRIPGRVIDIKPNKGVVVLTGDSGLLLTRVELEGKQEVAADRVLNSLNFTLFYKPGLSCQKCRHSLHQKFAVK